MKSLLLLPFLLREPDVTVLSKASLMIAEKNESAITEVADDFCDELKYNYLNEKTELQNFISRQSFLKHELKRIYSGYLSDLTEEEILQQLVDINKNIKAVIQKLNYLADEKFTSEKYQLYVTWVLPVFERHLEEEYVRVVSLIKHSGFRALNEYELNLYRAGRPFTHREYELNYFYHAGEESNFLRHDFSVDTGLKFTGYVRNNDRHKFRIKKLSSKLEICQFIPTLEIGLEITETVKSEWMPAITSTKQLYLKFEENK